MPILNGHKHIIWDWNGTLFDDAWLCVDIMNGMLARWDLPPVTPASYEALFDFPVRDYYRTIGWDFSVVPFETLSDEFISTYYRRMNECPLRGEARELYPQFSDRLASVEQMAGGIGWGFSDFVGDVVRQLKEELGGR